nr:testis-specific gene A8 protein-like [Aegilops tauschii subsp. strangulata]
MASSDSDSDGAAPGGVWPSSLTQGQKEDLFRFGLFVPPAAKNRRQFWKGKRFNDVIGAFKRAARGLPVGDITGEAGPSGLRGRGRAPPPGPAPPAPAEAVIPPEVAALRQDGDPEDTPGLLAALARSAEEAAAAAAREAEEASEIAAAIQATEAMAAPQAAMAEEEEDSDDVPVDWTTSRTGPAATMTAATARP